MERSGWASGLAGAALGWGLALIGGALLVPVYGSESASATLVDENGAAVLIPVAVPALIAALVWVALWRGSRASGYVAWSLIGALGVFCLLAILSIGLFALPVAVLLALAAARAPSVAER